MSVRGECIEILTKAEIEHVLEVANFHQRVRNAANLFIEKLRNLQMREPRPHVVICALPKDIVDKCGTKRRGYLRTRIRLTGKEREILRIIKKHRRTGQTTLVPFEDRTLDMIPEASDLKRIIKAEAMSIGIPTRVRTSAREGSLRKFQEGGEKLMGKKEIAKSNLETMIKIYRERKTNTNFIDFQERLQDMKEEVERLKEGNPRYTSKIDEIIREIAEHQTTAYVGYLNSVYVHEISKISEKISRLKMFMSVDK